MRVDVEIPDRYPGICSDNENESTLIVFRVTCEKSGEEDDKLLKGGIESNADCVGPRVEMVWGRMKLKRDIFDECRLTDGLFCKVV